MKQAESCSEIIFSKALVRSNQTEWKKGNISENKVKGHGEQRTGELLSRSIMGCK